MDGFNIAAPDNLSDSIKTSLRAIASRAPGPSHDWVLIGSMAARLVGADIEPEDVDIVASRFTIQAFLDAFGLAAGQRAGHPQFRSVIFKRANIKDGLPIEFMGDMTLMRENARTPFQTKTRFPVTGDFGTVFVPSVEEQISILRRFGRGKDLARVPLLQAVLDQQS